MEFGNTMIAVYEKIGSGTESIHIYSIANFQEKYPIFYNWYFYDMDSFECFIRRGDNIIIAISIVSITELDRLPKLGVDKNDHNDS